MGENPLNALLLQHGVNMQGDLTHGMEKFMLGCVLFIFEQLFILLTEPVLFMLSVLSDTGAMAPGLGMHMEPLGPIKPPSVGRTMGREPESPTNTFTTNHSALQGMSVPLLGSVLGADGSTLPMVRDLFQLRLSSMSLMSVRYPTPSLVI